MGRQLNMATIVVVLCGFTSAAPKPLDFDEVGKKIKEFGEKAMPVVKGTCGIIDGISTINDQFQGRINQHPQFNPQYPQYISQYNPFAQMNPQNQPPSVQNTPIIPRLPPATLVGQTVPTAQVQNPTGAPTSSDTPITTAESSSDEEKLKLIIDAVLGDSE